MPRRFSTKETEPVIMSSHALERRHARVADLFGKAAVSLRPSSILCGLFERNSGHKN